MANFAPIDFQAKASCKSILLIELIPALRARQLQVPPMYCHSVRDAKRLRPYTQAGGKVTRWSLGAQDVLAPTYRRKMDGSKAVGQRGSVAMLACFSIPFTSP